MSRSCTVYKITCLETNKIYVGITSLTLYERFLLHWYCRNRVNYPLYLDMRQYPKTAFKIEKIETAHGVLPVTKASKMEKYWIYTLQTEAPNGYNYQKTAWRNYMSYIEKRLKRGTGITHPTKEVLKERSGINVRISTSTYNMIKKFVGENKQYSIGGLADLAIVQKIESLKS